MRSIKLQNKKLQALLQSITETFYSGEIKHLTQTGSFEKKDTLITKYHGASNEYLYEAFKYPLRDFGYPRSSKMFSLTESNLSAEKVARFSEAIDETKKIGRFLGIQRNALIASYPDGGYIGWHHNGNAPGYNILFSYSLDGDGGFSYWNYDTKSVVTIKDEPGWNVKVGYYPSEIKDPNRVYWHAAKTAKHRVSVAYVIDHKEMWKNMIEDVTMGEYDESITTQ